MAASSPHKPLGWCLLAAVALLCSVGCQPPTNQQIEAPTRSAGSCDDSSWAARYDARRKNGYAVDGFNNHNCLAPAAEDVKD
jgi:hypothetical protein